MNISDSKIINRLRDHYAKEGVVITAKEEPDKKGRLVTVLCVDDGERSGMGSFNFDETIAAIKREASNDPEKIVEVLISYIDFNLEKQRKVAAVIFDRLMDFERLKACLSIRAVNKSSKDLVDGVPVREAAGDIVTVVACVLPSPIDCDEPYETYVTNDLLEVWGKTFDEVYAIAKANCLSGIRVKRLTDRLRETGFEEDYVSAMENMCPLFVVDYADNRYGFAGILFPETLEKVESVMDGRGFYIFPSSVHEALALDEVIMRGSKASVEKFDEMVRRINQKEVDPCDYLSDHSLYYSRATGLIPASEKEAMAC